MPGVMSKLKQFFKTYPLVSNAVVYGSLYVGAEFSQQTINNRILAEGEPVPYDTGLIGRYAVLGTCVFPPILYSWYKWLDAKFVGTAPKIVLKKLVLDQSVLTPPLLVIFYVGMSLMERKPDVLEECKKKLLPTFKTSCMYWLPMQSINFFLVPPQARVVYVGCCTFVWVNILCWFKRQSI